METRHIQALIELWERRHEPAGRDIQLALHIGHQLEINSNGFGGLKALAWHIVTDAYKAVGWDISADDRLTNCHSAATSVSHASALLCDEVAAEVKTTQKPVLLLGALPASYSLFGRWDALPAHGAALVPLTDETWDRPVPSDFPTHQGVRWANYGPLTRVYRDHAAEVPLDGVRVHIPNPELIAARTSNTKLQSSKLESLIFCAAARSAVAKEKWEETVTLARKLGRGYSPVEAALNLKLDKWLDLEIKTTTRLFHNLRRSLRVAAAT